LSKSIALPRTQAALERLAQSVIRLEAAVAELGRDDDMAAELEAARAEQAALQQLVDTVSDRLDGAIGRLRTVLEE
jgi:hypothetical protein